MHHRSLTSRSNRARSARLLWPALAALCVAGCQSNSERDLIARDRRMQEDQIYAMQDYISQYQKLLCRYRSENAALRCRLAEERGSGPALNEPQPMPRTPTREPNVKQGPDIEVPQTPSNQKKQAPKSEQNAPDVPPLGQRTSDDVDRYRTGSAELAWQGRTEQPVAAASYIDSDNHEAPSKSVDGTSIETTTAGATDAPTAAAAEILLSGEVVENKSGGPRLVVDIEPFDRAGRSSPFDGNVSMMLLTSDAVAGQRKLARWDFGPDEVHAATDTNASDPTMRFHVELPAGTHVGEANELWVRLMPTGGSKLLSHAKVDLSRPGVFSSRTSKLWASEESVVAASYAEPAPKTPDADSNNVRTEDVDSSANEGSWATAQPGKPANLPDLNRDGGGWRASSETMSAMVTNAAPAAIVSSKPQLHSDSKSKNDTDAEIAERPSWSPDRAGKASRIVRPTWSATR